MNAIGPLIQNPFGTVVQEKTKDSMVPYIYRDDNIVLHHYYCFVFIFLGLCELLNGTPPYLMANLTRKWCAAYKYFRISENEDKC